MATLRFLLTRFAAQRLLGLAVIVTLAFSVGVLVAGPIYADAAREAIFTSAIGSQSVTVVNARYQVFGGPEFDWTEANEAVADRLANSLPVDALVAQGLSTVRFGGPDGPSVPLLFRDGAEDHLDIRGNAPRSNEIALPADLARSSGLEPGETVTLVGPNGRRFHTTVTATFDPPERDDPFWFGPRSPFPEPGVPDPPPLLVSRDVYLDLTQELALTSEYTWDAYLGLDAMRYDDARTTPGELVAAEQDLHATTGLDTIRVTSGLDTVFRLVEQRVQNLRVPILLVVIQIGAVTLAVLAGVGALALTRQSFELAVLHSRGFSRRTLLSAQGAQAAFYGLVGFPLGLLLGLALARLAGRSNGAQLPGVRFPVTLNAGAVTLGAIAALVGALILLALSVPLVKRTVLEERRSASREERPLLSRLPVELIVLPLGIFAYLQLRGGTKPTVGEGTIDPLVLAAPTLLLFAASFLALRLLLFVLRRLDRRIGSSRRLPLYLAGRRLGRSPGTGFAAALLLLLAMGLLVVSTSYRGIVLQNHADAAHVQVGADWRVSATPPDQELVALADMPALTTGVVRTEPAFTAGGSFSLPPVVLGIDPDTFADGGWWRDDFSATSLDEMLDDLQTEPLGAPIQGGALQVQLEATQVPSGMQLQATSIDAGGKVSTAQAPMSPGLQTYDLDLGDPARLLSITFHVETGISLPLELEFRFASVTTDGNEIDLAGWEPVTWRSSSGTLEDDGDGSVRYTMNPGAGNVIGGIWPALGPMPAILSDNWPNQDGDQELGVAGQNAAVRPIATASQFPGLVPNAPFVVISGPALLERQLAIPEPGLALNEVWANTPEDPSPLLEARGFVPGVVEATAPIEGVLAQLPQSLAVGMNFTTALAGLGLVVIGVAAGLYFTMRRRDYEFAALRAMGTPARSIRRTLILEQVGLLGFALVAGLVIGYLLLRLMMPYVGTSLGVSYPAPVLVIDWVALGTAIVAIVVATGLALSAAMRVLMGSSVTGVLRGEAE